MGGEDYDGFRLDFGGDLLADFLEFGVGWVIYIFHDVGAAMAQKIDWGSTHRGVRMLLWEADGALLYCNGP